MSPRPQISVIIPTHNTRCLTLRALASLESDSTTEHETLLVDDASGDDTAAAVQARFPRVLVLRNATTRGFSASVNLGLARAHGEVLLLLNSDTELEADSLVTVVGDFSQNPRLGALGAQLYDPDGSPQWSGGAAPTLMWLFALASGLPRLLRKLPGYRRARPLDAAGTQTPNGPRNVDWVTGAALAIRRGALEQVGALDERFRFYAQDLEYCLRLREAGWEVAIEPRFRVLHHHGATIRQGADETHRGQHLELLWEDLLRWAVIQRGEPWARRARWALRIGGGLRLAACVVARPFLPRQDRDRGRRQRQALENALANLVGPLPQ